MNIAFLGKPSELTRKLDDPLCPDSRERRAGLSMVDKGSGVTAVFLPMPQARADGAGA